MKTLVEFVKDKRRADCVICNLPEEVLAQVRVATDKDINRRQVKEWLESEYQIKVTEADQVLHTNGRHP